MTRAAWAWAAATSCLLVAGNGCSHPAPYGQSYGYPTYPTAPGGYPASPGAYPASPGAYPAAPGGSYVVPGGSVPGSLGAPSSSYPSGSGPTLAPPINGGSSGGSIPQTFDPNSPSPTVPNYEDPTTGDFGTDPSVPDDGFRSPQGNGAGASPFYPNSSAVPRSSNVAQAPRALAGPRPDYLAGVDEYDSSKKVSPASFETTANADFGADPAAQNSPQTAEDGFGYEHGQYQWLRGVVDFDPVQKTWHIIYGLTPNSADKYGGSLTLADNGQLTEFQDNDVVLVEGTPDPQAGQDVLGKPYYRVSRAELLGRFE